MADLKILVAYYSRSGTTRKVAQSLAAALQCDSEEIVEDRGRSGMLGYLRSVIEARRRLPARIASAVKDPSTYDLIVVGTPVWAWSVSSPVRAYMIANKARFPAVAFFCTFGGAGADRAFAQMQDLAGKRPVARLTVRAPDFASGRYRPRLTAFVESLRQLGPAGQYETTVKGAA
jgi:flavodoxin